MQKLISLEDAKAMLMDNVQAVDKEDITLSSAISGRILSEDIFAPINLPPFDRSPLDGYAVRSKDIENATPDKPVELKVCREIPAGSYSDLEVDKNEAVKILTGAPIPPGADVVIRFEDVEKTEAGIYTFNPLKAFSNYCFAGEDIEKEELVLSAGSLLEPPLIGLLAGLGFGKVPVYCVPKIAIISTGDELVDISKEVPIGKIYNSNMYTMAANVQKTGAEPILKGIAGDAPELIASKIDEALQSSDMIITTGGVSVGDYDSVKDSLLLIGAEILFHRINIRPGTPALCAVKDGKTIICLSGNPGAAFVTYYLVAQPAILKLMGINNWQLTSSTAILEDDFNKVSKQRRFLRGQLFVDEGILKVRLTGKQNPGILRSAINCNALIDIPANSPVLKAGEKVKVIEI